MITAASIVRAKVIQPDSSTRLYAILGAKLRAFHFTTQPLKSRISCFGVGAVASVGSVIYQNAAGMQSNALASVQTRVGSPRANVQLVLALQSDISSRANTVFKVLRVGLLNIAVLNAIVFQAANILGTLATDAVVFTLKQAGWDVLSQIFEFADGSYIAVLAVAAQVSV